MLYQFQEVGDYILCFFSCSFFLPILGSIGRNVHDESYQSPRKWQSMLHYFVPSHVLNKIHLFFPSFFTITSLSSYLYHFISQTPFCMVFFYMATSTFDLENGKIMSSSFFVSSQSIQIRAQTMRSINSAFHLLDMEFSHQ